MSTLKTRALAALTAVAALAMTAGGAVVANADTVKDGDINTNQLTNLSVTFHKYESSESDPGTDTDGKVADHAPTNTPLEGVKFKLYEVKSGAADIDLSKADGWKAIQDVTLDSTNAATLLSSGELGTSEPKLKITTGSPTITSAATNAQGEAVVTNSDGLNFRLYVVEEDSSGAKKPVKKAMDPFFLTMPLKNVDAKTSADDPWLYQVNVYPKNDIMTNTDKKEAGAIEVDGSGSKSLAGIDFTFEGGYLVTNDADKSKVVVPWTATAALTAPQDGKAYKTVKIEDTLDAINLEYKGVRNVKLTNAEGTDTTLESGDYTVTVPANNSGTLVIALTDNGLAKANNNIGGTFSAEILTYVKHATKIDNNIKVTVDNRTHTTTTDGDNPDGGVKAFATLKVTKKDEQGRPLVAKFQLVDVKKGSADDAAEFAAGEYTKSDFDAKKYQVSDIDAVDTYTSTNGEFTATVEMPAGLTSRNVCVVETTFPAGYRAKDSKIYNCFTITADTNNETADPDATKNIVNVYDGKFTEILDNLPETGATGLVVMTAMGALLIGAGVFAVAGARRREQE